MKTIFILLLFFCNSLQAQTAKLYQTSEKHLDYFKSYLDKISDRNGFKIVRGSVRTDFLYHDGLIGRGWCYVYEATTAGDNYFNEQDVTQVDNNSFNSFSVVSISRFSLKYKL